MARMHISEYRPPGPFPPAGRGPDLAPWRPRKHDPAAFDRIREGQEAEERLFRRILAEASQADAPLAGLFALTLGLSGSPEGERRALAEKLAANALAWHNAFDDNGDPLWISLAPYDERKKETGPESTLPADAESAAPSGGLRFGNNGGKENTTIPARENPLFTALDMVVRRLTGTPRQEAALARPTRAGHNAPPPPKRRMLAGVIRTVALGVCLAVMYHILAGKGWAPRLF